MRKKTTYTRTEKTRVGSYDYWNYNFHGFWDVCSLW